MTDVLDKFSEIPDRAARQINDAFAARPIGENSSSLSVDDSLGTSVSDVTSIFFGTGTSIEASETPGQVGVFGPSELGALTTDCATDYSFNKNNIVISGVDAASILDSIGEGSGQFNVLINAPQSSVNPRVMAGGSQNTAVGLGSFQNVRNASGNTVVGAVALQDMQQDDGDDTGGAYDFNTVVGANTLANMIVGSSNVVLGAGAASTPRELATTNNIVISGDLDDGSTNRIVIGAGAYGNLDDTVRIGGSSMKAYAIGGVVTVAALPSAATMGIGSRAFVTDSNATLAAGLGNTVVGSGSNKVPVHSDGANWKIG